MGRTLDVADAVKGRQVTGWGEYALSIDRIKFSNAGFKEGRLHTDHRMVLAIILWKLFIFIKLYLFSYYRVITKRRISQRGFIRTIKQGTASGKRRRRADIRGKSRWSGDSKQVRCRALSTLSQMW